MSDGSIVSGTLGELGDKEAPKDKSLAIDPVTDSRAETGFSEVGSRGNEAESGIRGKVGLVEGGGWWDG
jgi:hypothetical protein